MRNPISQLKKGFQSLLKGLPLLVLLTWSPGCYLSHLAECGKIKCDEELDKSFLYLALLQSFTYSCDTPPVATAPWMNDTARYSDSAFSGRIDRGTWDGAAVRRVLHTFVYGGPASNETINRWASMDPGEAIVEILSLDPETPTMTPSYTDSVSGPFYGITGSLRCAEDYIFSSYTPVPDGSRSVYATGDTTGPERLWYQVALSRGGNPFRQMLGMWETNYHMSINQAIVPGRPTIYYYDTILDDIASGLPYQTVLANAALSAAIAVQYNHRENRFEDGRFSGNEDFAREFHQLFFGILGTGNTSTDISQDSDATFQNHEQVTIPSTAKALTDMTVQTDNDGDYTEEITFGTDYHYHGSLSILEQTVEGSNASDKIHAAAAIAIGHSESINTLPLIIVRGLADDNLVDTSDPDVAAKISTIQNIWSSMGEKNILVFLRRYAISTAFHNSSRYRFRTGLDRHMTAVNLLLESGQEINQAYYTPVFEVRDESMDVFRPLHDVFGGMTGNEAADTPDVFLHQFNLATGEYATYGSGTRRAYGQVVFQKDFSSMIPPNASGDYTVKDVTEWLWNRFIGDSLRNLGDLERAHIYALLVSGTDLPYYLSDDHEDASINSKVYTVDEIKASQKLNQIVFIDAPQQVIHLNHSDETLKSEAVERVAMAANFILSTPFAFAQEGL